MVAFPSFVGKELRTLRLKKYDQENVVQTLAQVSHFKLRNTISPQSDKAKYI